MSMETLERSKLSPEQDKIAEILSQAELALMRVGERKQVVDITDYVDFKGALQRAIRGCESAKDADMQNLGKELVGFRNRMFVTKEFTDFQSLQDAYQELAMAPDFSASVKEKILEKTSITEAA